MRIWTAEDANIPVASVSFGAAGHRDQYRGDLCRGRAWVQSDFRHSQCAELVLWRHDDGRRLWPVAGVLYRDREFLAGGCIWRAACDFHWPARGAVCRASARGELVERQGRDDRLRDVPGELRDA